MFVSLSSVIRLGEIFFKRKLLKNRMQPSLLGGGEERKGSCWHSCWEGGDKLCKLIKGLFEKLLKETDSFCVKKQTNKKKTLVKLI